MNVFLGKALQEPVAWTGIDVRLLSMHRIYVIIESKPAAKQGISKKDWES